MKRSLLLIALQVCFAAIASAQSAVALKQQNLADWQIGTANYSGITPMGDNRFAIVSDKEPQDGFFVFRIDQNRTTGKVQSVYMEKFYGNPDAVVDAQGLSVRDCEGIAFFPSRGTLFIAGEGDQEILEYGQDGVPTGRKLNVPAQFGLDKIQSNGGFESLAYCKKTKQFWTTTENTLRADAGTLSGREAMVDGRVRLVSFDENLQATAQYAYRLDKSELATTGKYYANGVSDLCALPDGRIVVLERELNVPQGYVGAQCVAKLYVVDPANAQPVSAGTNLRTLSAEKFLTKQLLVKIETCLSPFKMNFANYEGVCLGATLDDGRQTLLLLNDSQASMGKGPFHLKDYIKVVIL